MEGLGAWRRDLGWHPLILLYAGDVYTVVCVCVCEWEEEVVERKRGRKEYIMQVCRMVTQFLVNVVLE